MEVNKVKIEPNRVKMGEQELFYFYNDLERIENQELDLIFDPLFNCVCDRITYNKMSNMMEWECAICGTKILIDKRRGDVDNFVCERCKEVHNNKNTSIDRRILDSRTKLYKMMEKNLYDELEDNLLQHKNK